MYILEACCLWENGLSGMLVRGVGRGGCRGGGGRRKGGWGSRCVRGSITAPVAVEISRRFVLLRNRLLCCRYGLWSCARLFWCRRTRNKSARSAASEPPIAKQPEQCTTYPSKRPNDEPTPSTLPTKQPIAQKNKSGKEPTNQQSDQATNKSTNQL